MGAVILYATWPDEAAAAEAARSVLGEGLAACVNLHAVRSLYRWRGALAEGQEVAMIVKTTDVQALAARDRLAELHPYKAPAILALPVLEGASSPATLAWLRAETSPTDS